MLKGLLFMKQTCRLAHHDVSLENVMLDGEGGVQIIDMGLSLRVAEVANGGIYMAQQPRCGKPSYVAPEVVFEEPFDPFTADILSLGVCLYSMLTARPLYNSPKDLAFKIMAKGGAQKVISTYESYGLRLSPDAKHLVILMLQAKPSARPTLEEIERHPLLAKGISTTNMLQPA